MCSVGDDFEEERENHMVTVRKLKLSDIKCNKCREEIPILLLRHKDAYCKKCFLAATNHKFKSLLGKSKLIRPHDKVMVSYEIGHPSTALMHMLRSGLDLDTPKKLRFEPVYIFLEDQYHLTLKQREEMVNKVLEEADSLQFQLKLVSFAESLSKKDTVFLENGSHLNEFDNETLDQLIRTETNKTNRKEILSILRRNTLLSVAKKLQCKYIFSPELSVDIASNLLTNISLGRGSQIPLDTGFCDNRDEHVTTLRPLRAFDMKEVALYNVLNGLEPVSVTQPPTNQYSSIQALTKQFINDLQENYPATIATVVRTGDKLTSDQSRIAGKCKLCKGNIMMKAGDLSSEESTNFSKLVSNESPDHGLSGQEKFKKIKDKFDSRLDTENQHCFTCSKILDYLI